MFRLLLNERSDKISVVTANSNNKLLILVRRHQSGDKFWLSSYRSSVDIVPHTTSVLTLETM